MKYYQSIAVLVTMGLITGVPVKAGAVEKATVAHEADLNAMKAGVNSPDTAPTAPQKLDESGIRDVVNQQLKRRFEKAAGKDGYLTPDGARAAGWGIIADHFTEIDRDNKGFVSLAEVLSYLKARSPLKVRSSTESPDGKAVQIIQ
ncbi:hypothetical protein HB779_06635 [Phyllobacterium sp. 628]|uniref:hypothetical protein n=1 Tax=Phyllobacterium sp. 628 TaxID=2718938 RepID=UPI00166244D7|nr:hypothetical protein [Phyllobacterium sp. 628]QND51610.1 hypothetical protein HB779_06635 [Phyllobacterium sp. 628]